MKNNKKIIALTTTFLLLFVFWSFLLPMVKATETYITTEEIEDFSCVDDTYVYSGGSYLIFGDSPLLTVGYDIDYTLDTEHYNALFKFNLTNRPENYIKAEVVLSFNDYGINMLVPFYLSNNSWNEEEATYEEIGDMLDFPPIMLPFSFSSLPVFGVGFIDVSYDIDITEYSESQLVSVCLIISYTSSDFEEDISTIYSKEYPVESVRPKIIWTVEHEIIISPNFIPPNNDIVFLLTGLIIGLGIGLVIAGIREYILRKKI